MQIERKIEVKVIDKLTKGDIRLYNHYIKLA